MSCPKCGNEIVGAFCSNCGYKVEKSIPGYNSPPNQQFSPSPASTPYQQTQFNNNTSANQQYIQQNPFPDWYKDGSIMGLILVVISFIIFWSFSMLFGWLLGLVSLIIAATSKKRNGRIVLLSTILTTIVFVIEIIIGGFLILAVFMLGY
ncbi:MAG: hypothetical protein ACTSPA_06950 [Promethearchaeota archaeon]